MGLDFSNIKCGIIGAGKLGLTLAEELSHRENFSWLIARSGISGVKQININKSCIYSSINEIISIPDLILLCVPDSEIATVAEALSLKFKNKLSGVYLSHFSGVWSSAILDSCRAQGALTGKTHPFQTFASPNVELLKGIGWGVESEAANVEFFREFVSYLNGKAILLPPRDNRTAALYHASAAACSNYLTASLNLAKEIAQEGKFDWIPLFYSIALTSVENNLGTASEQAPQPLTGPISRGDSRTVKLHLDALSEYPSLLQKYCLLGLATAGTAYSSNQISLEQYNEIASLLCDFMEKA